MAWRLRRLSWWLWLSLLPALPQQHFHWRLLSILRSVLVVAVSVLLPVWLQLRLQLRAALRLRRAAAGELSPAAEWRRAAAGLVLLRQPERLLPLCAHLRRPVAGSSRAARRCSSAEPLERECSGSE